ncbi:protein RALF-like 34 [Pistacia vera]|uniref:protein RALF-like 34 n=1 Tax=Pistacia vera TaxID=55513 RepID=UPI0012633595|nr:protein RALF-like 34 [Pistacia vera]
MAFSALKVLLLVISMILTVKAQVDQASFRPITSESLALPWTMAMYDELGEHEEHEYDGEIARRSLYRKHYYISYGALSADRIPCAPRSGRSYYTHNCHRARGPANPYTRGCSAITHCRR